MRAILTMSLLAMAVAPAFALPADKTKRMPKDPNRVICRNEEVIGSRLQTEKRCMTAFQWDQYQREQRQTVDKVQAFKPNNGG